MNTPLEVTNVHKFNDLVCPLSKQPLWICKSSEWLYSPASNLAYPIKQEIPVMLPSEARPLTDNERAVFKAKLGK